MKSIHSTCHLMQRLALLVCACFLVLALPASAKDKSRGSSHHYNPHYNGHSNNGHSSGHSNSRSNHSNFKQYNPGYGYYQGYYRDYPVYAPQYRGRSYYGGSNYGRNQHNSLLYELLRRL